MPKKRVLAWLAFCAAAAAAAAWAPLPQTSPAPTTRDAGTAKQHMAQAPGHLAALPQRDEIGKPAAALFPAQSWSPPAQQAAAAPAAPVVPPMPYRVAGTVVQNGVKQIVLARGDTVLTVREGDTLDGTYRVDAVNEHHVTLTYLPMGAREDLPVTSPLAEAATPQPARAGAAQARLAWDGPKQVSAGSTFRVALKLTSTEAIRAAPLELSFDPALVRPIAVQAGDFFSGGMFSYRVNPGGSIFIGASGKGAVPSDAEFLVVNFEPIRASGVAEVSVSSLSLQDAAGRAIAYREPGSFRTAIVR
jgi:hypothetical protein